MSNILITGASGMLGALLVDKLKDKFNVYATGNSYFENQYNQYMKFDLKSNSYKKLIDWSNPDIVIHCGALTNVNFCEENPQDAFLINSFSIKKFLESTSNDVKLIYISTDAVFNSSVHLAKETDSVNPENIYGKSKELGEFFLKTSYNRRYVIIRTTIVGLNINSNKKSFVEWIINNASNNKKIGLFTDVLFTPISIWHLAKEINHIIESNNICSETLHISGELCTKYEFGYFLLKELNISTQMLSKSQISNFKDRANRSNDQSLDSNYYFKKNNRKSLSLKDTINKIKYHYENNQIRFKKNR